jgi:hypothetical protein
MMASANKGVEPTAKLKTEQREQEVKALELKWQMTIVTHHLRYLQDKNYANRPRTHP